VTNDWSRSSLGMLAVLVEHLGEKPHFTGRTREQPVIIRVQRSASRWRVP